MEDVVRAYEHLIQVIGIDSEKIIVMGDSAGAALVLEMLFITHDPSMFEIEVDEQQNNSEESQPILNELPRPAGTVLISPLVTDQTTSESWKINQKYDYITQYTAKVIKRDYFEPVKKEQDDEENNTSNQILGIAKLQTGFSAFLSPQVLMYVGNLEVLRDDAIQLALKAEQDGVAWQTVIEDNVHDWFCVREVVKDKSTIKRADQTFADFCFQAIGGSKNINNIGNGHKLPYYNTTRDSLVSSGLAVVNEEEEEEDNTEESYYQSDDGDDTTTTTTNSSTHRNSSSGSINDFSRLSKLSLTEFDTTKQTPSSSAKRSSEIVFV